MMRMTPTWSGRPAFLYQACCAAVALRNLSIMPGLTSERRTMLTLPVQGSEDGAVGICCAAAGVGQSAGLRDRALKTVRARNRRERRMVMSPMRRQHHGRAVADHLRPVNCMPARDAVCAARDYCGRGNKEKRRGESHDVGEFFQLFAHGGERAGLDGCDCSTCGVVGDSVSAHDEE